MTSDIQAIRDFFRITLELRDYREHKNWCEIDHTEFCTCGLKEIMDKFNKRGRRIEVLLKENQ